MNKSYFQPIYAILVGTYKVHRDFIAVQEYNIFVSESIHTVWDIL